MTMTMTMTMTLMLCAVVAALASAVDPEQPVAPPPLTIESAVSERIDRLFQDWEGGDSPGCAIGVIRKEQLVYRQAFGLADVEHRSPLTTTSLSYVGSMAKQFTAMAILLLEQDGKLALGDDIRRYVPELPD